MGQTGSLTGSHTGTELLKLRWNYQNGIGVEKNERKAFDYYKNLPK